MWTYLEFEVTVEALNKENCVIPYHHQTFNSNENPIVTTYLNRSNDLVQYLFHQLGIPYSPKVLHTQNIDYDLLSSDSGLLQIKSGGPSDYQIRYKRLKLE